MAYVDPREAAKVQRRKAAVHAANVAALEAHKAASRALALSALTRFTPAKAVQAAKSGPVRDSRGRFVKASA